MASQPQPPEELMDKVSLLVSSNDRLRVVEALTDTPKNPTKIVEFHDEEIGVSHVSRSLSEMADEDLVELLVSEDRKKGRIYGLTEEGEKAAEYALEM